MSSTSTLQKAQHPFGFNYFKIKSMMSLARLQFVPLFTKTMPNADPRLEGVSTSSLIIPTTNWGNLNCVTYASKSVRESLEKGEKVGLHINLHASGFIFHSMGMDRYFLEKAALELNVLIIDLDYPKSPEYPFPSPIQSTQEAVQYFIDQPIYDSSKISIGGFSAGAAIALAVSSLFGPEKLTSVTAFFPMLELEKDYDLDMAEIKHPEVITPDKTTMMKECYVVKGQDLKDPRLTLRYADPLTFPNRVTVTCANGDSFFQSCKEFIDRLSSKREKAKFIKIENQAHNFDKTCGTDEARVQVREETYDEVLSIIKEGNQA